MITPPVPSCLHAEAPHGKFVAPAGLQRRPSGACATEEWKESCSTWMMRVSVAQHADTASLTSSSKGPRKSSTAAAATCTLIFHRHAVREGWSHEQLFGVARCAMMPPPSLV
jgi:hypothetical protein